MFKVEGEVKEICARESIGEKGIPVQAVIIEHDPGKYAKSLSVQFWKDKADALATRFANAAMKAAKLLEPKTQRVHLSSSTLKTEADVKAWLVKQEKDLLRKLADGPIVIS